ncbi:cytochrome P450 2G1-like [Paramacrobiotus metropolitanus]|uniref:cytochrome P450 2G1-like n=1 Tax=Paramacrobiotus metropolitanus TaxID=2943436 RepID=UPI002445D081|nr:cytochrome P450 2G1-like [Paramacrobiotus metropolitanus]
MILLLFYMALLLLLIILLSAVRLYLSRPGQDGTPPGPIGVPFLGYIPFLGKYPWVGLARLRKTYPQIVALYWGGDYTVVLQDYETVRAAYVDQDELFLGRPEAFLLRYFSTGRDGKVHGIMLLEGDKWRATHNCLTNTIKNELGAYTDKMDRIFVEESQRMSQNFAQAEDFIPDDFLNHASMRAVGRVLIGRPLNSKEFAHVTQHDATFLAQIAGGVVTMWPWTRWVPGPTKAAWNGVQHAVEERFRLIEHELDERSQLTNMPEEVRDFIGVYLHSKNQGNDNSFAIQSRDDLVTTMVAAFTAGSEASTVTMLWAILYMCAYPDIQNKAQEELERNIEPNRSVCYSDIERLPYTVAVLYETIRLSGLDPLGVPRSTLRETHLLGYRIPKRTKVMPNFWAINRNPDYYPDPLAFKPERFIGENGKVQLPKQFIPFSTGSRTCAGMHLAKHLTFVFFANILRNLRVRLADGQKLPAFDDYRPGVSLRPTIFKIHATRRL